MTAVNLFRDDITNIEAAVLITTINPEGLWYGNADGAIRGVSGDMFYDQLPPADTLLNGQTFFVPASGKHSGRFDNVLFVVDNGHIPLHTIITTALEEADRLGIESVSLPTARPSVNTLGFSCQDVIRSTMETFARVIVEFINRQPANVKHVNVAISKPEDEKYLRLAFLQMEEKFCFG